MTRPPKEAAAFAQFIAALFAAFNRELGEATLTAFELALDGVPLDDVARAVKRAILDGGAFPPSAGDLRRMAPGAQPSPEDRAGGAWSLVLDAIRGTGGYRTPVFADPLIAPAIARLGGWPALCEKPSTELHQWTRKAFAEEYTAIGLHGLEPGEGRALVGIHGQQRLAAPARALPAPGEDGAAIARVEALIAGLLS